MDGVDDEGNFIPEDFTGQIENVLLDGDARPIRQGTKVDGEPYLPNIRRHANAGGLFDPNQEGGVRVVIVSLTHIWVKPPSTGIPTRCEDSEVSSGYSMPILWISSI